MENIKTENGNEKEFNKNFKTFFLNPVISGLYGFAAVFSFLLLSELFSYLTGLQQNFNLSVSDVVFSLTGFVLAAGVKFMEFFSNE